MITQETQFAAPQRDDAIRLQAQTEHLTRLSYLSTLYDALEDCILILNENRQVIFANKSTINALGVADAGKIIGQRPGEVLSCAHSSEMPAGCGTSKHCSQCGAVLAILMAQDQNHRAVSECMVTTQNGDAINLRVSATPLDVDDMSYTILGLQDISEEKRRHVLERIFFHDILNTAGGVRGLSQLMETTDDMGEIKHYRHLISSSAETLVEEIESQRQLTNIENHSYKLSSEVVEVNSIINSIYNSYVSHPVAANRNLVVHLESSPICMRTDPALLKRVIGNMVKNALEACQPNQTVTLGCEVAEDRISFSVHNPTVMPESVRLQVFKRSFSTKGDNRGLGTYSMKLISERYLNGTVGFESKRGAGTTFHATYPLGVEQLDSTVDALSQLDSHFAEHYPHKIAVLTTSAVTTAITRRFCRELGYQEILPLSDATTAVEIMSTKQIDCLILEELSPDRVVEAMALNIKSAYQEMGFRLKTIAIMEDDIDSLHDQPDAIDQRISPTYQLKELAFALIS